MSKQQMQENFKLLEEVAKARGFTIRISEDGQTIIWTSASSGEETSPISILNGAPSKDTFNHIMT